MNVRFLCGEKKDLNKVPLVKGQILFITDEKTFYLDVEDPKDANNTIRVSTYPEEIVNARKVTNSNETIIYNSLNSTNNIFGRLVGSKSIDYITNIKLYALDTRTERIRVEYNENHYEGKNTDRSYATFTCKY